jgi:hypothetical protein
MVPALGVNEVGELGVPQNGSLVGVFDSGDQLLVLALKSHTRKRCMHVNGDNGCKSKAKLSTINYFV